jgi:hypothetical protein
MLWLTDAPFLRRVFGVGAGCGGGATVVVLATSQVCAAAITGSLLGCGMLMPLV